MNALVRKVALVTGATSGIGRATAIVMAKAGAKVVAGGRRVAEGESLVADIKTAGGDAIFVRTDVTRENDIRLLVEKAMTAYGRLDIAFNNAGVLIAGAITEATVEDYQRVFDVNVRSVLLSMKHQIPAMLRGGGGSIINMSSAGGHVGMANVGIYVASKHAVEGLTKAAALEYARQGIRVNAVAPAAIDTAMVDNFVGKEGEQREYLKSLHPVGRTGKSEEVANAVLWLASDAASFVTGHSLLVDGGFTAQ